MYDLQNDPGEMKNLVFDPGYKDIIYELKTGYYGLRSNSRQICRRLTGSWRNSGLQVSDYLIIFFLKYILSDVLFL